MRRSDCERAHLGVPDFRKLSGAGCDSCATEKMTVPSRNNLEVDVTNGGSLLKTLYNYKNPKLISAISGGILRASSGGTDARVPINDSNCIHKFKGKRPHSTQIKDKTFYSHPFVHSNFLRCDYCTMPRGVSYKSLPDDEGNDHPEEHVEAINPERTSVPSAHPQEAAAIAGHSPNDAGLKGEEKDDTNEKKEPAGKSDDTLGGLPTVEGVFVGDPVPQSVYPTSAPAPVRTMMPHISQDVGVAARGGVTITAGAHHVVTRTPGTHQTIILLDPSRYYAWGRGPQPFVCNNCGFSGLSHTYTDPCSNAPILAAVCCCLVGLWPCSFVPFLIPDLRDTVHQCPGCRMTVGRSQQFR